MRPDFASANIWTWDWNTIITRNINEIFYFNIPQGTIQQENVAITNITIASARNYSDFKEMVVDISGNTPNSLNISDLGPTAQQVYSNIYYQNITQLQVNTRYRTFDMTPINNTITLNVTLYFTPADPTFPTLMISAVIPTVVLLVVPSAIAYTKFKKTGFLAIFFVMTLILTVTSYIPIVVGILMMIVMAIIFYKLLRQSKGESDE